MNDYNIIDPSCVWAAVENSRSSKRGRAVAVIHPPEKKGLRVIVNAIQPPSYIQPHKHMSAEYFAPIRGQFGIAFFDESGQILEKYTLSRDNVQFIEIPLGRFHTAVALDSDSVLLDMSEGPYNPKEYKEFPQWAPKEPEEGLAGYGEEIREFMKRLRAEF